MLIFKGRVAQVFSVIKALAQRHPDMTIGEYWRLCITNGGR